LLRTILRMGAGSGSISRPMSVNFALQRLTFKAQAIDRCPSWVKTDRRWIVSSRGGAGDAMGVPGLYVELLSRGWSRSCSLRLCEGKLQLLVKDVAGV
jgi:hypothetical protein